MIAEATTSVLSRTLHDLLHREAHLKLWRTQLTPLWSVKEAELRAVQAARPRLFAIMPRRKRDDYLARHAAAQDAVNTLRARVDLLDRCEPYVAKMIEHEIAILLRDDCPEYTRARAALGQKEDWERSVGRFAEKIFELTRALGNVRNLACSGYARHTQAYSGGALQAFGLAFTAAQLVEEEVKVANKISDAQLQALRVNGVMARPLPRLPETSFSAWVAKIKGMPLVDAQTQFDTLIETTKQLHETEVVELRAESDRVELTQESETRNFLRTAWDKFRSEVASEIYPGDTERTVAETERMLLSVPLNSSVLARS